jgi:hypothetical protein
MIRLGAKLSKTRRVEFYWSYRETLTSFGR